MLVSFHSFFIKKLFINLISVHQTDILYKKSFVGQSTGQNRSVSREHENRMRHAMVKHRVRDERPWPAMAGHTRFKLTTSAFFVFNLSVCSPQEIIQTKWWITSPG